MSATGDQAGTGAMLDAEEAHSRIFAHDPGEGEALWWLGMLATIKATGEQTGGQSSRRDTRPRGLRERAARPSSRGRRFLHPRR
jgi:hypothetical protein